MSSRAAPSPWALFLLSGVFICACTIRIGPYKDDGASEDDRLPEPDHWTAAPPALTPEQEARQAEVDGHIKTLYNAYNIAATKQGPSGDIFDWVDSNAFELPYDLPVIPFPAADLILPEGIEPPQSELDLFPELLGPEGTTPLLRPDFSAYVMGNTGAVSLQDYLDNHQVFGVPTGIDRLYTGVDLPQASHGIMGIINHYKGEVEEGTFSVVEMSVACPAEGMVEEAIGVVFSIDRVNFSGSLDNEQAQRPRIHIETLRQVNGQLKGIWDMREPGFVPLRLDLRANYPAIPIPGRTVLGGEIKLSDVGGAQVEQVVHLFQVPSGDWWIAYRGELLGYYPASLYSMLNTGACRAHWYEEVYKGTQEGWTTTDMGSGEYAEAGANHADYFRRMMVLDPYWLALEVNNTMGTFSQPYQDGCYSRTQTKNGGPFTGFFFFCGGPGSDSPLCQ